MSFHNLSYSNLSYFLIPLVLTLISNPIFTLSFQSLNTNPNYHPQTTLYGDAQTLHDGAVQLNNPIPSSSGLLIISHPFKFIRSNPTKTATFSTDFTFSISPHNGNGLLLVIVPTNFASNFPGKGTFGISKENRFVGVEFDTFLDGNVGDKNANHVGVDLSSLVSVRVSDVSKLDVVLNSGVKLQCWIDYHAKRLDVRLSKFGEPKPDKPVLSHSIDLGEMWKEEEVVVGLISSSGNSQQTTSIYTWSNTVATVPKWMHSLPVNPLDFTDDGKKNKSGKSVCFRSGFIFAVTCGALAALVALFVYLMFADKYSKVPAVVGFPSPVQFRYEKIDVVVKDSSDDIKK